MEDPEFDLIMRVAGGDTSAFEQLVKRYQRPVINFIRRYIGDIHSCQDLAQEVFLRVFQAAPRFEPRGKVSGWIFTIAYNLSSNELKRRKRINDLNAKLSAENHQIFGGSAADQSKGKTEELLQDLMAALGEVPEKQRAAFLLKVNEGLSYSEIATVLGVSVSSVESLIFRARMRLKLIMRNTSTRQHGIEKG
jgi:RNA polymerase sigma-70 factor, ECF subfamily